MRSTTPLSVMILLLNFTVSCRSKASSRLLIVLMHPRNPYRTAPNFAELAESYPALREYLIQTNIGTSIDFHDSGAQRRLTQALLHRDFGLKLSIPDDRLCPPVPNRLNYILWLQDVMDSSRLATDEQSTIIGVDIGTGASAIYPLLGYATRKDWHFIATEIDTHSFENAIINVRKNALEGRIQVVHVSALGPIFDPSIFEANPQVDFTMCNPPFYSDRAEVLRSAEAKELGPNAVCTGADTEMITPGGEVAFVSKMVQESLVLKTRCRWYSSMLGKMSSLTDVVKNLHDNQIDNYAITEFVQGKTRRWALAWSFTDERLPDSVARISNPALQSIMPPRNTLRQPSNSEEPIDVVLDALQHVLFGIESTTVKPLTSNDGADDASSSQFLVRAIENTWSRAARRKKLSDKTTQPIEDKAAPALTCLIGIVDSDVASGVHLILEFQWVRGTNRGLFESFVAHVSRKVETALKSSQDRMIL